jgi:two-component system chemotaxis sensor kinase CheA
MNDALHAVFVEETSELVAEVEAGLLRIERVTARLAADWRAVLGALHTIKGNCGMVELDEAAELAHVIEQRVKEIRGGPLDVQQQASGELLAPLDRLRVAALGDHAVTPATPAATPAPESPGEEPDADSSSHLSRVKVPATSLDRLLEATGELAAWHEREAGPDRRADGGASRRLRELRDSVMALRLVPLSVVLARFERLVRDLARATGRAAALRITGAELAVDKQVAERLSEPLLHVVRNSVAHGIEPADERLRAGKPADGTIEIVARADAGMLEITIRDDGRGIDARALADAAARRGVDVTGWPRERIVDLVFAPELTTAREVTSLAGRGVGLDQTRRALERVGGAIVVESTPGRGTAFRLRLPLVLAVQRALLVRCAGELFAVPFTSIAEVVRLPAAAVAATGTAAWRDQAVPLSRLADELGLAVPAPRDPLTCLVVARGDGHVAVVIDEPAGHLELMIRELDPVVGRPVGVTGAAELPDGRIVPVLDLQRLGRAGEEAAA